MLWPAQFQRQDQWEETINKEERRGIGKGRPYLLTFSPWYLFLSPPFFLLSPSIKT